MNIYLAHPISGLGYDGIAQYYKDCINSLGHLYDVLCPLTGKSYLRNETKLKAVDINLPPPSTNHAIIERDSWMVRMADIVYVNYQGCSGVSIGTTMELAWAYLLSKHTIVVLDSDDIHKHAFVVEAADILMPSHEDAIAYLVGLASGNL